MGILGIRCTLKLSFNKLAVPSQYLSHLIKTDNWYLIFIFDKNIWIPINSRRGGNTMLLYTTFNIYNVQETEDHYFVVVDGVYIVSSSLHAIKRNVR